MEKIKKIIFGILTILLAIVLIYNIYNFVSLKVLHKDLATVNGYSVLEVVSGSMEPTIHVGDMIIIDTKDKNYKVNDIVTFYDKEGSFVTHRIISIDNNVMVTKGDNNDSEDVPYSTDNIIGKYVTKISGAGRVLSSFKSPFTLIMIFISGVLSCVLLSTNEDGKPILDSEELEFQEFLKQKEERENKDSVKVVNKKSAPKTIKNDTRKVKSTTTKKATVKKEEVPKTTSKVGAKKTATTKKTSASSTKESSTRKVVTKPKTTISKATKAVAKKEAPKVTSKIETQKVAFKTVAVKKEIAPKKASSKVESKKSTPTKKVSVSSSKTEVKSSTQKVVAKPKATSKKKSEAARTPKTVTKKPTTKKVSNKTNKK